MRRIKVAMIGINFYSHAQQIWKTITSRSDVFEVVGYVLPENEREKYPNKMAMLGGYPELTLDEVLNDSSIDAVVIETDEIYLTKYALMAARVGKPMHMEKPGGHDLAQFEELVRTVKEKDLLWHVGYMLGVILSAYRDFSARVKVLTTSGLSKPDRVREIIKDTLGKITKAEIMQKCPYISQVTVQRALNDLVKNGDIIKIGGGRYTSYVWNREK